MENDRVPHIRGRRVEKEDKNNRWHRVESSNGEFLRRFRLPENAKLSKIKASREDGVLTVTVPKEEVKEPDVKSIGDLWLKFVWIILIGYSIFVVILVYAL